MERPVVARCVQRLFAISAAALALASASATSLAAPEGSAGSAMRRPAAFKERIADRPLVTQLRKGGFVLFMRQGVGGHGRTDAEATASSDCRSQHGLSAAAREDAAGVGAAIRRARIPVGEVLHDPHCRARETAQLAFGDAVTLAPPDKTPVHGMSRQWLSMPVPDGTNRVVVAPGGQLARLLGYLVEPRGTIVVIRPLGLEEGFEYVASIPPALWRDLSN